MNKKFHKWFDQLQEPYRFLLFMAIMFIPYFFLMYNEHYFIVITYWIILGISRISWLHRSR